MHTCGDDKQRDEKCIGQGRRQSERATYAGNVSAVRSQSGESRTVQGPRVGALSCWFAGPTDIARLEPWFDAMPMLTVVSLPPKNDVYALQATSRLRLGSPGRPITVISREVTTEVPWKLAARALISAWLRPCGVPSPTAFPTGVVTPTPFGSDTNTITSGDNTDDEDTVVADLIYM